MTVWIVAGLVAVVVILLYQYKMAKRNRDTVAALEAILAKLASQANEATEHDKNEAKTITTAKGASDFLNSSGGDGGVSPSGTTKMHSSRRRTPSNPVNGFARGQGDHVGAGSLRPGSVLEG